jgi:hypothetical protein
MLVVDKKGPETFDKHLVPGRESIASFLVKEDS